MRSVSQIGASIRAVGVWPYCIYQLGRLLRALSLGEAYHYCIMSVDLHQIVAGNGKREAPKLTVLKRGDPRLEQLDADMDVVRRRFDMHAICSGLVSGGELRAWIWHVAKRYDEDEVRATFELPASVVWDFGAFVTPKHRIGRSFERLWHGFAHVCHAQGISYSLSRIGTHNTASLRAHMRLPHKVLGYCTFIRIFSLQLCISPLLPKWHISRNDLDKPVFEVRV